MRAFVILCACFLLSACVGTVQTYSGGPRPLNQVAVVKGVSNEFGGGTYRTFFTSYALVVPQEKPEFVRVGDSFIGFPNELHMASGKYLLLTKCYTGNQYAFPSLQFDAVEGMTYEVVCEPIADELSKVKVSIRNVLKTVPVK